MTTTPNDATSTPRMGTLAALRAVAADSSCSTTSMFDATSRQAWLLRNQLPPQTNRILVHLSDLIPSVRVDYIDNLPVPGTAFWGNGHWRIHVRADDSVEVQVFTVLHEFKHIIDHPLRQQPNLLGDADWEALADYFAGRVLAQGVRSDCDSMIKRDSAINDISTDLCDSPSQYNDKTGGVR